jgi:ATP-binding cassette subfamily C (CFTR/MRP) protein 1
MTVRVYRRPGTFRRQRAGLSMRNSSLTQMTRNWPICEEPNWPRISPSSEAKTHPIAVGDSKSDDEVVKLFGKRKAKRVSTGQSAVEDGVLYDISFTRVLFSTIKTQWFLCLFLNGITCQSLLYGSDDVLMKLVGLELASPLLSRQLIQQISIANAYHAAETAGQSTVELDRPRQLYHVCGLAVALFAVQMLSSLFYIHWQALAARYGVLVRSSVGLLEHRLASELTPVRLST